jgi:hypothetical protein
MSMGRDYISELRTLTGLLFIYQEIYEHGEPWQNDNGTRKLLSYPPEHTGKPTIRRKWVKKIKNLVLQSIFVHALKGFLT